MYTAFQFAALMCSTVQAGTVMIMKNTSGKSGETLATTKKAQPSTKIVSVHDEGVGFVTW